MPSMFGTCCALLNWKIWWYAVAYVSSGVWLWAGLSETWRRARFEEARIAIAFISLQAILMLEDVLLLRMARKWRK